MNRTTLFLMVGLLVASGTLTATAYENSLESSGGYLPARDGVCWDCHSGWTVPLREVSALIPPSKIDSSVGDQIEFGVRIANSWLAPLTRLEAELDLANAPSLEFASSVEPILGRLAIGSIAAASNPIDTRSSFVTIDVPIGANAIVLRMTPANQDSIQGPNLRLEIFPGLDAPAGNPKIVVDNAGPGATETFALDGKEQISALGYGTWSIRASVTPVGLSGLDTGAIGQVDFSVENDLYFNTTGSSTQAFVKDAKIVEGTSTRFTWILRAVAPATQGEEILIRLNTMTTYVHNSAGNTEDYGYFYNEFKIPVEQGTNGGPAFDPLGSGVVVGPGVTTGISTAAVSEVIGYISAFLVLASIYTGGMFGKATRRQLNVVFQTAKRRVAFHNFLSYGIILAAIIHTAIFLIPGIESGYHWTVGLIWGTVSILAMFGLGVTGAIQVQMIRRWNYGTWRWTHFGLAVAVIVFTVVHIALDGSNWGEFQSEIGWSNPLYKP